jgi:hypothetical protein
LSRYSKIIPSEKLTTIMPKSILEDLDAVASWFFGPCAENQQFVVGLYNRIVKNHIDGRIAYKNEWKDPDFFGKEVQQSDVFKKNMERLENYIDDLFIGLNDKTVPFWSPRYMGHMVMESTMASSLGYVAALQFN